MIKKLLSILIPGFVTFSAAAQITITQADVAGIGTIVRQAEDTMPAGTIIPGPAGTNLIWNFAALDTHLVDTLAFTNPAWTPNGSSFPGSNLAVVITEQNGGGGTAYLDNNSTGLYVLGQADTGTLVVNYTNNELIVPFPATYGTTYTDTSVYSVKDAYTAIAGYDSVLYKSTTSKTGNFDAWGTLTTPLGSFSAIRTHEVIVTKDSIWLRAVGPFPPAGWYLVSTTNDTSHYFGWWANNVGFPLVEIDSTSAGIEDVHWLIATPTVTSVAQAPTSKAIKLFPNPASTHINVVAEDALASRFNIFDVSGRMIRSAEITSTVTPVAVDDLPAGMYIYTLQGQDGNVLNKGKFNIIR